MDFYENFDYLIPWTEKFLNFDGNFDGIMSFRDFEFKKLCMLKPSEHLDSYKIQRFIVGLSILKFLEYNPDRETCEFVCLEAYGWYTTF